MSALALAGALLAQLAFGLPALGQAASPPPLDEPASAAPADPLVPAEEAVPAPDEMDRLFVKLRAARSPEDARAVEAEIWQGWLNSGSATVDLLVERAMTAMQAKAYPLALQLLDSVVELAPDYAEGWNKRATVHFLMKNYGESIGDIQRTLTLENRHFGALSGLGQILNQTGQKEGALDAFRRALRFNPHLRGAQDAIDDLAEEVEGRGI